MIDLFLKVLYVSIYLFVKNISSSISHHKICDSGLAKFFLADTIINRFWWKTIVPMNINIKRQTFFIKLSMTSKVMKGHIFDSLFV